MQTSLLLCLICGIVNIHASRPFGHFFKTGLKGHAFAHSGAVLCHPLLSNPPSLPASPPIPPPQTPKPPNPQTPKPQTPQSPQSPHSPQSTHRLPPLVAAPALVAALLLLRRPRAVLAFALLRHRHAAVVLLLAACRETEAGRQTDRDGRQREGKGREGKGREGKGREGKGREGKERERKQSYKSMKYKSVSTRLKSVPAEYHCKRFTITIKVTPSGGLHPEEVNQTTGLIPGGYPPCCK